MIVILLAINTMVFLRSVAVVRQDSWWVSHSNEVLATLASISSTATEAESGARGYVVSADVDFLKSFEKSQNDARRSVEHLKELVADNAAQVVEAAALEPLLSARIDSLRKIVAARETDGLERAAAVMASNRGPEEMERLQQHLQSMRQRELDLLVEREHLSTFNYRVALTNAALAGMIGLVVLAISARMISNELKARKLAEEVSDDRRQRLEFTLACMGDAVLCVDAAERVTYLNAAAEKLMGWTDAEAKGLPLAEVFNVVHEDSRKAVGDFAQQALLHGQVVALANHVVLVTRDGREIPIDDSAAPVRDGKGRITGAVLIFRDVSQRRTIERLNAERDKLLHEEERRKDAFLATLAHELRNPLAPISNGLELMALQSHDAEAVRDTREGMLRQLRVLGRLIDDLVDISRINRGIFTLHVERVLLNDVIRTSLDAVRPLIDEYRHVLNVAVPDEPIYLRADSVRLAQVLTNLLMNAAKFTPPGGHIRLTVERLDAEVTIRITDSGVGIAPYELHRIFDMFYQIDSTSTRRQGGLGIGLSLAKSIVEKHGGSISARSEGEGRGAEFVVRLPATAEIDDSLPERVVNRPGAARNPTSRKILVVDDMKAAAKTISRMLILLGQQVRTMHDAKSALQAIQEENFDMVISDIAMPEMSGYELASRIRALPGQEHVVLVALTGYGQESDVRRAKEAGFNYHYVKPIGMDDLQQVLFAVAADQTMP